MNEMMTGTNLIRILITAILVFAVVEDLRTKKFANTKVIAVFFSLLILQILLNGPNGLVIGLTGALTALVVLTPIYLLRIIGGGDVKLMIAIGVVLSWKATVATLAFAFVWGALIGLVQIILNGKLSNFVMNYQMLLKKSTRSSVQTHTIPFTVALLLGWLSHLSFELRGIEWSF